MAARCPNCGSNTVSHNLGDNLQCLSCGQLFDSKGDTVERGPDATTRAVNEARMAPRTTNLAGNYADLQRLGGEKAPDPKEEAFKLPPGVDKADVAKGDTVNQPSEVVAGMSRTDVEPADEKVDAAKALQAKASRDDAAEVAAAKKKSS
jgi:hypothetical protein